MSHVSNWPSLTPPWWRWWVCCDRLVRVEIQTSHLASAMVVGVGPQYFLFGQNSQHLKVSVLLGCTLPGPWLVVCMHLLEFGVGGFSSPHSGISEAKQKTHGPRCHIVPWGLKSSQSVFFSRSFRVFVCLFYRRCPVPRVISCAWRRNREKGHRQS